MFVIALPKRSTSHHLAAHTVLAGLGLRHRKLHEVRRGWTEVRERAAAGEMRGRWGEDIATLERGARGLAPELRVRQLVRGLDRVRVGEEREQAVVRTHHALCGHLHGDRPTVAADAGVDNGEVHRARGKRRDGAREEQRTLDHVVRRDLVREVVDAQARAAARSTPLSCAT